MDFTLYKERFKLKFESIIAKDNCLRIPKIYQKLFFDYSFIKIFAIEVSAFDKIATFQIDLPLIMKDLNQNLSQY